MGHTVCMKTNTSRGTYMGRRLDVVCKWGGRVCGKKQMCPRLFFFNWSLIHRLTVELVTGLCGFVDPIKICSGVSPCQLNFFRRKKNLNCLIFLLHIPSAI
jgi:hypothetical protein